MPKHSKQGVPEEVSFSPQQKLMFHVLRRAGAQCALRVWSSFADDAGVGSQPAAQWLADSTPQASLSAVYKASSVAAVVVPPRAASSEADVPGGADRKSQQEALGIAQKASM